jgi:four helix bundle protein
MATRSYEDLRVWQKAMELVEETYRLSAAFPKNEEFGLKSQMRRAAISIPSNIAEGQGRHYPKVFREFLYVALGSLYELRTQLELTERLGIQPCGNCEQAKLLGNQLGKMLHRLVGSISSRQNPQPTTNYQRPS